LLSDILDDVLVCQQTIELNLIHQNLILVDARLDLILKNGNQTFVFVLLPIILVQMSIKSGQLASVLMLINLVLEIRVQKVHPLPKIFLLLDGLL
jgi:hypothetical protein